MGTSGILPHGTRCLPSNHSPEKRQQQQSQPNVVPSDPLRSAVLALLLLLDLEQQRAVDVWQDTTESDRRVNEGVEFFVTADGELQVSGRDALDFEVLCGVSGQLEYFGCEVFQDGGHVDGGFGADAHLVLGLRLEETLHTTAGELKRKTDC
jgi:hypothetical protein